jgi:hypothetical protein
MGGKTMADISQGESCTIPKGHANASVQNLDANKAGSYDIVVDGNSTKKQIDGGATQNTAIHQNEAEVTNTGKPVLRVANCNK